MGRDSFDRSKSPVKNHRSSHRSPPRRERSPPRHRRSSYTAKSPGREKPSSHTRSPVRANSTSRSPSPRTSKRSRRDRSNHKDDKSSERGLQKNHRSPVHRNSRSPESPRTRRLKRAEADKANDRSPVHRNSRSPESPRTRRLKRAEADKVNDRATRKEKKALESEIRDRKSGRHRSRSPPRDEGNHSKEDDHRNGNSDSVARMKAAEEALESKEKQKPSFELSGKLAAETNRVKGVTLLFTEPPDARKPDVRWRLYVFKGGEVLNEPLYVHRQTCYLFGRERRVADIPTDHPSCSKQHAVLQYRQVEKEQPDGMLAKEVRPYIMDLGSTNGTFINDDGIEPERYYELMEKDTIKFGNSSREYVLLHENSAG